MWSIAVYDFGLTSRDFWKLQPKEYRALSKRYTEDQRKQDMRAAIICEAVMKANGVGKCTWKDFMPQYGRKKKKSGKQLLRIAKAIHAAHTGEIIK